MSRITDEKLDRMLTEYCTAEPEQTFVRKTVAAAKPIPLYRRTGFVMAASVVLVSAAVIALMLAGYGKKPPVAVYTPPVSEATSATLSATEPSAGETVQTEKPGDTATESQPPTSSAESTDAPLDTAPETNAAQEVEEPAQNGSEATTAAPQTEPVDESAETVAAQTEPATLTPEELSVTCSGSISSDRLGEDGKVYFQIVATGESIFDDPGVFDDSHLAQTNTTDDGFTIVSFTINRLNVYSPRKKHYYCFYNSNGDILYRDGFD